MHAWCERGIKITQKARKQIAQLDPLAVKTILVIRHAALGDMVLTRPFLVELRKFFPNAKVTLDLVTHYQVGVPTDLVDESHVTYGPMEEKKLVEKIQNLTEHGSYDLLFDLANTSRSQWTTRLTKAKIKLGFPFRKTLKLYDVIILRSDFKFEAETLLDFLQVFGSLPEFPLNFKLPRFDKTTVKNRVGYFLGASLKLKRYPQSNFVEVISKMVKEFPQFDHCILEGTKLDEKYKDLALFFKESPNVRVIPVMSVDALTNWLSETHLMISNDTGVRNMALSTHTPTVGIFFEAIPYRYIPRYEHVHEAILCTQSNIASSDAVFDKTRELLKRII